MKSSKLLPIFSIVFIAVFGIVLFVGGNGITSAKKINHETNSTQVQEESELCDDGLSRKQAKKAAKNGSRRASDDCESNQRSSHEDSDLQSDEQNPTLNDNIENLPKGQYWSG